MAGDGPQEAPAGVATGGVPEARAQRQARAPERTGRLPRLPLLRLGARVARSRGRRCFGDRTRAITAHTSTLPRRRLSADGATLTGDVFEHAEHFALRRHSLDVRVVLQRQQAAGRRSADVHQLKVAGEVGRRVFPGNDAPFQRAVAKVPQGTADVQAAGFGREVADKSYDVFCRNRPGRVLKQPFTLYGTPNTPDNSPFHCFNFTKEPLFKFKLEEWLLSTLLTTSGHQLEDRGYGEDPSYRLPPPWKRTPTLGSAGSSWSHKMRAAVGWWCPWTLPVAPFLTKAGSPPAAPREQTPKQETGAL